ncbi:uncharacterized protein LOC131078097 isoform X2 [Cryptomeria japonica]|uniref:uncharacterized protein LOC131078097 isoform X2 n=1 Tax=Cryptomeria japonica TaxID=3369 RepID=UPI0025ABDC03|nr:uncharacterized protein LOC131078097 isoform X2 [Cryptomeria japonica]
MLADVSIPKIVYRFFFLICQLLCIKFPSNFLFEFYIARIFLDYIAVGQFRRASWSCRWSLWRTVYRVSQFVILKGFFGLRLRGRLGCSKRNFTSFRFIVGRIAMADVDLLELKFRLHDGTDIGPHKYDSASTISTVKESIIDKGNAPKRIDDIMLITAGKVLENNKTLTESWIPMGELPVGVITMLVIVRSPNKNSEKDLPKSKCLCIIM